MSHDEYYGDDEDEIIEGYCVRCKQTIEIEDPKPVWTRRGMPATRGECPDCGGIVFRMGYTVLHNRASKPDAVQVGSRSRAKLAQDTAYINFAESDEAAAQQIAADLEKTGIACWLHESSEDATQWAGGVHPALSECARMVLVLSPAALTAESVQAAWGFFKDKRKPVLIAQVEDAAPPDAIRRSPRFDFSGDYKPAFRQMVQALSD
ncbi:MAG: TIR domain-containing protein [Anaerolineae bacterium]|nr:TIR domain-containing protein [Anaerolineae bacterium]